MHRLSLVASFSGYQLAPDVRQIVINEWRVLVTHLRELLLNYLEFIVGHVIKLNKTGSGPFDSAQKFIQLQGNNSRFSILCVLNQEYHQERDDRRAGVDE